MPGFHWMSEPPNLAALHASCHSAQFRAFRRKLQEAEKPEKAALTAMAWELLSEQYLGRKRQQLSLGSGNVNTVAGKPGAIQNLVGP